MNHTKPLRIISFTASPPTCAARPRRRPTRSVIVVLPAPGIPVTMTQPGDEASDMERGLHPVSSPATQYRLHTASAGTDRAGTGRLIGADTRRLSRDLKPLRQGVSRTACREKVATKG